MCFMAYYFNIIFMNWQDFFGRMDKFLDKELIL